MVTYTVQLTSSRDGASGPIGVVTADLQLDWLRRFIGDVKIGRTGFGVMVSPTGRVTAHPESALVAVQLSPKTPPETRRRLEPLVRRMLAGASGFEPIVIDGRNYRAVFRPINPATGWLLAALYPEDELMADARRLSWLQAILAL